MEEFFDQLNAEGQPLGIRIPRSQAHREGLWHRTVHIWVFCGDQVLLQQRSFHKDSDPGLWDISCAGHISAGQEPLEAALRELQEELGLTLTTERLQWLFTQRTDRSLQNGAFLDREFHEVYQVELHEAEKSLIHFDPVELEGVAWWGWKEFLHQQTQRYPLLVMHTEELAIISSTHRISE